MPDALEPPIFEHPIAGSLDAVVDLFREGTALVDAALAALIQVSTEIETTRDIIRRKASKDAVAASMALIRWHLDGATVGSDNLLVMNGSASQAKPLLVFALCKTASGALTTQTIPIERAPLVVIDADASTAFGELEALSRDQAEGTTTVDSRQLNRGVDRLADRIAAARSRLSIIKARLDLQSSFVSAVANADKGTLSARVDSHVNSLASALDLAMETRRLLSRQTLGIGSSNSQVIQTLFQRRES